MPSSKGKNTAPRERSLTIEVTDEDLAYAQREDQYACAFVRAIQRTFPEALRVTVNKKEIAFSIEDTTPANGAHRSGWRYTFDTPTTLVRTIIRPFDEGKPLQELMNIPLRDRTWTFDGATSKSPMSFRTPEERTRSRANRSPSRRSGQQRARQSVHPRARAAGRFVDQIAAHAEDEDASRDNDG